MKFIRNILSKFNYALVRIEGENGIHMDFESIHNDIWKDVSKYTMTTKERIFGLIEAVQYVTKNKIQGDIVECGVWKGGSMMAAAKTFARLNDTARQLYLYDTFEGMSAPTAEDANPGNKSAGAMLAESGKESAVWAYSTLETVQSNMAETKYPSANIHYVKGKVEDTIPGTIPEKIAILRLDTDWYESTKHELIHLFPRLQPGGVLIIDDYGYWQGAKKAVNEYFAENKTQILLCRMDNTGRIAIKQG